MLGRAVASRISGSGSRAASSSPFRTWVRFHSDRRRWCQPPLMASRRWASSASSNTGGRRPPHHGSSGGSSTNSFRAGVVDSTPFQVKPNFHVPVWQPPARFMKYRAVRWLSNNLLALATYQLTLEVGFTILFGSLLYAEQISAQGVRTWLEEHHYPFTSWVDVDDCVYTEPVHIGPFALNPHKMTALHTGHNIANGLLPVQVVLMLSTFSPVNGLYRRLRHLPAAAAAASTATATSSAAAAAGTAAGRAGSAHTATASRRASYARATSAGSKTSTGSRPF